MSRRSADAPVFAAGVEGGTAGVASVAGFLVLLVGAGAVVIWASQKGGNR